MDLWGREFYLDDKDEFDPNKLSFSATFVDEDVYLSTIDYEGKLDADYAFETTELARTQIIQQAATAMLSQANQYSQSVLSLLK